MVRRAYRQRSLVEVLLPDADKLWDPTLRRSSSLTIRCPSVAKPERALWAPALDRHIVLFDHAPQLAVADGGFASRANERAAQDRGVRHVVLPRQPRETRTRAARAALRWRTGSEGRISALKRRHGLRRCRYRGVSGMQRWVGLGVLANDLLVLARAGP